MVVYRRRKRAVSRDHVTGWTLITLAAATFPTRPKTALLLITRRPCAAELMRAYTAIRTRQGQRVVLFGAGAAAAGYAVARLAGKPEAPAGPA